MKERRDDISYSPRQCLNFDIYSDIGDAVAEPLTNAPRSEQSSQTDCSPLRLAVEYEELQNLTGSWEPVARLHVDQQVEVLNTFLSWDKVQVELRQGSRGKVLQIDADGDAKVEFPVLGCCLSSLDCELGCLVAPRCWVRSADFSKLGVLKHSC